MCLTCVAAGTTYAVPAIVGLKVYAARARGRRSSEPVVAPGELGSDPSIDETRAAPASWS